MDYKNLNDLWHDTLFNIGLTGHKLESRVGDCKEILGFQATLTHPLHNILFVPQRKFSLAYACAEMLWYLSGASNIEMIKAYAPQYEKFAEDEWAYGAYGKRWACNPGFVEERNHFLQELVKTGNDSTVSVRSFQDQLTTLIYLLKTNPNTRQAIMTMWDSGDLVHTILGDHKDLPCTLSLMFFVRDEKLHLITTMRSNDAWLGLPYDIFCFTTLQRIIATELGLGLGAYVHQAGSEHIYAKNQEKIDLILEDQNAPLYPHPVTWNRKQRNYTLQWNIEHALTMEKEIRNLATLGVAYGAGKKLTLKMLDTNKKRKPDLWEKMDPMFKDLVLGCATKWTHIPNDWFDNPLYANCQRFALQGA